MNTAAPPGNWHNIFIQQIEISQLLPADLNTNIFARSCLPIIPCPSSEYGSELFSAPINLNQAYC